MDEMTITWHALRRRFELGLSYLDKYDSEYKASTDRDVLVSPVSTAPEVYDNLAGYGKSSANNVAKLMYLYENVPHLRDTMPSEWQKEPSWLPAWIEAPTYLKNAFPDRDPERRPFTLYYSTDGLGIRIEKGLTRLLVVTRRIQEVTQRTRRMMTKDQEGEVPPEDRRVCHPVERILPHQTGAMEEQGAEAPQVEEILPEDKED
ncbi:hypothetical protein DFH09DRAFT_1325503 [Mycena vulgaris]|nr:hypothetical protein DFH09DRAFT_1325503 [Mycena vulgaris]